MSTRMVAGRPSRRPPAILDVPVGKGRVLLYATNPCYRWQNHGEFNPLFGAILAERTGSLRPADVAGRRRRAQAAAGLRPFRGNGPWRQRPRSIRIAETMRHASAGIGTRL